MSPTAKRFQRELKTREEHPFQATSSYAVYIYLIYIKTNFIDWKYNANNTLTPLTEVTVIPNLKFIGKTIYTDNFGGNQPKEDIEDRKFAIKWAKRPNLKWPDFPLVDETSN